MAAALGAALTRNTPCRASVLLVPVMNSRLVAAAALVVALAPVALARVRAVHHPAERCSYQLVPAWGTATIPAAGVERGMVFVYGQTATCSQWLGYSSVDWATVVSAPSDAQPAAYVTVAPNTQQEPRTTTLVIAGVRLELTQDAAPAIANPGLVTNGTFHTNIANWGWQSRFPNGRGTAMWSPIDANGSPNSGSILLRDLGTGLAFQQLQCIPANPNTTYRLAAKVRTGASTEIGEGILALFTYPEADCSTDFTAQSINSARPASPGVWQEFSFTMRTGSRTRALLIVIASSANVPPFETWFDDIDLRPF